MRFCAHLGKRTSVIRGDGFGVAIHHCEERNCSCVQSADDLFHLNGSDALACEGCDLFVARDGTKTDWLTCKHREVTIGEINAPGCGCDKKLYQCALHGKCLKRLPLGKTRESFGESLEGVTICRTCDGHAKDAPVKRAPGRVAVIIPCHNYGRFLAESIESVLFQTLAATEIVVVDDDSSDDTAEVAARFADRGVKYIRVDYQNVFASRRHGLSLTNAPYVVFLDADDKLCPTYLDECVQLLEADERIGIANSDVVMFGSREGKIDHGTPDITTRNYIHSAAMVRRIAIDSSGGLDDPICPHGANDDWFLWRRIARCGWRIAKIATAGYLYRQHPESMMHKWEPAPFAVRSAISLDPMTVFVPLSGRKQYWPRMREFLEHQRFDELIITNSGDDEFKQFILAELASMRPKSFAHIELPDANRVADIDRRIDRKAELKVCDLMPLIYRHLRDKVRTDYVFIVEDDVMPPPDTLSRLLSSMEHDVAAVSGAVPSRFQIGRSITWRHENGLRETLLNRSGVGVEEVDGTGFGCLLLRRSAFASAAPFNAGGTRFYDVEFARQIKSAGWKWLIDWSIECGHGEI